MGGLNSFFAFSVVLGLGYSWQMALTAVFIEGIIFVILTFFNVRELIVKSIPGSIKNAIPVGIGLFITFLGLQNAGLIVKDENTMLTLGAMSNPPHIWVASAGLILTAVLYHKKSTRGGVPYRDYCRYNFCRLAGTGPPARRRHCCSPSRYITNLYEV